MIAVSAFMHGDTGLPAEEERRDANSPNAFPHDVELLPTEVLRPGLCVHLVLLGTGSARRAQRDSGATRVYGNRHFRPDGGRVRAGGVGESG